MSQSPTPVPVHDFDVESIESVDAVIRSGVRRIMRRYGAEGWEWGEFEDCVSIEEQPEPYRDAYEMAAEAAAAGDDALAGEVANALRFQQSLFDGAEFDQRLPESPGKQRRADRRVARQQPQAFDLFEGAE